MAHTSAVRTSAITHPSVFVAHRRRPDRAVIGCAALRGVCESARSLFIIDRRRRQSDACWRCASKGDNRIWRTALDAHGLPRRHVRFAGALQRRHADQTTRDLYGILDIASRDAERRTLHHRSEQWRLDAKMLFRPLIDLEKQHADILENPGEAGLLSRRQLKTTLRAHSHAVAAAFHDSLAAGARRHDGADANRLVLQRIRDRKPGLGNLDNPLQRRDAPHFTFRMRRRLHGEGKRNARERQNFWESGFHCRPGRAKCTSGSAAALTNHKGFAWITRQAEKRWPLAWARGSEVFTLYFCRIGACRACPLCAAGIC